MARDLRKRFLEKVKVGGEDECWEWQASTNPKTGYGQMSIRHATPDLAHRISWRLFRGDIPDGKCVLHECDNRRCVNPKHLFLGTRIDNMDDMNAKGRGNHGGYKTNPNQARARNANGQYTNPNPRYCRCPRCPWG